MKTVTYFEDLGASAAYWIGAQSERVVANPTAMVGSIGTFAVLRDTSELAREMRIKVHVIRAGQYKGMGTPGTEVTDEHLAEMQRTINAINDAFVDGVATGRGLDRATVRAMADGRIHIAPAAADMGLIDEVMSFDDLFSGLRAESTNSRRTTVMANDPTPAPTIQDLSAALPKASDEFLVRALREGWSVAQAKDAYLGELQARLEASEQEASQARQAVTEAEERAALAQQQGVQPTSAALPNANHPNDDPIQAFNRLVRDQVAAGMSHKQATRHVVTKHPDAHREYLRAWNARNGRAAAVAERN